MLYKSYPLAAALLMSVFYFVAEIFLHTGFYVLMGYGFILALELIQALWNIKSNLEYIRNEVIRMRLFNEMELNSWRHKKD